MASTSSSISVVAKCIQNFIITSMDVLKLSMVAVDQVHPLLSRLFNKLGILPPDFEDERMALKGTFSIYFLDLDRISSSESDNS